jgi:hypothetical protein
MGDTFRVTDAGRSGAEPPDTYQRGTARSISLRATAYRPTSMWRPKDRRGTIVHARYGSYPRYPRPMLTLMMLKIGRLSHPSGHQPT